jgi:hypothetical protein
MRRRKILKFSPIKKRRFYPEGLIKIPHDLLKSLCGNIASGYISYLYLFDKHKSDAQTLASKYGVEIDPSFKPMNKEIEINTVLEGLPERMKNAWRLEFGHLRLIIDWEQKIWRDRPKVNASYEETAEKGIPGYFTINPFTWIEAIQTNYSLDILISLLNKAQYSAWHEASHAVQHNCLKWLDPSQVDKSRIVRDNPESDPEERRSEYLSSRVEFDPQIKTKIFQFQEKYGSDKENIHKDLAAFVGAFLQESIEPDEFFVNLKKTDLEKWKKAVGLIYKNYNFDISSLLRFVYSESK